MELVGFEGLYTQTGEVAVNAEVGYGFTVTTKVLEAGLHPGLVTDTVIVLAPAVDQLMLKDPPVVAVAVEAPDPKFQA